MRLIPFTTYIPPDERDPELAKRIIANELPKILSWALSGLKELSYRSFMFPEASKGSLSTDLWDEYEKAQSSVIEFLKDNFDFADTSRFITTSDLYGAYADWCEMVRRKPVANNRFGKEISTSFPKAHVKQTRWIAKLNASCRVIRGFAPKENESTWLSESHRTVTVHYDDES